MLVVHRHFQFAPQFDARIVFFEVNLGRPVRHRLLFFEHNVESLALDCIVVTVGLYVSLADERKAQAARDHNIELRRLRLFA